MNKGKKTYYKWSEGGGAIIVETSLGFELYEVPNYGGEERYEGTHKTIEEAKKIADKWT